MGRAEAIQTGVVDFQRYHCLSVCRVDTWETSRLLTLKTNLATSTQDTITIFFIRCLRLGSRSVHQTQIWVVLSLETKWLKSFLKSISVWITKSNRLGKKSIQFHFDNISGVARVWAARGGPSVWRPRSP